MTAAPSYTPAERKACTSALRHYPADLVARAAEGTPPRELVAMGFTQFQVSAVVALLTKARAVRSSKPHAPKDFREGL